MTDFTRDGRYRFDFTDTGFFTLMNKKGEPLYTSALPLFEKLVSHLVWIFFWLVLIGVAHWVCPMRWLVFTDTFLMVLIVTHLFIGGCRLTTLLISGGLKPILFPPLWVRCTRKLQKGEDIRLLHRHHLDNHPGLLCNLAWMHYHRSEFQKAQEMLDKALEGAPHHPVLETFKEGCTGCSDENYLTNILPSNPLK